MNDVILINNLNKKINLTYNNIFNIFKNGRK